MCQSIPSHETLSTKTQALVQPCEIMTKNVRAQEKEEEEKKKKNSKEKARRSRRRAGKK